MIKYTFLPCLMAVFSLVGTAARADEEGTQLQNLITKQSPSIVTVRAVLKTEFKAGGQSQDRESHLTVQGVVVDADGLIMVSNMPFSSSHLMEMFGGADNEGGFGFKMTPTSIKVTIEREEKEYDAFLAATDTKLDLAFIQIEGLADRKLPAVDFGSPPTPTLGQRIIAITRLSKGYDYAPYFQSARISGEVTKPRSAWTIDGNISEFGLPVFALSGEVIGVLTTITSGVKEDRSEDSMGFGFMMRLFGGGGQAMEGAFVLPASALKPVVEQAKKRAVDVAAERAKKKAEAKSAPAPATQPAKKPAAPPDKKTNKP